MVTTSYLLIGFLVANFSILWLVNWHDANIRSYTWKIMSSTVSIYLAVVIDGALTSIFLGMAQLISRMEDESRAFTVVAVVTQLTVFALCMVGMNMLCRMTRKSGQYLYASSTIGGHLTAFSFIGGLKKLVHLMGKDNDWAVWIITFVVFSVLLLLRFMMHCGRNRFFGEFALRRTETNDHEDGNMHISEEKEDSQWRELAEEGEDDASAIVQSFMIKELVLHMLFSGEESDSLSRHGWSAIIKMGCSEVVCLLLLMAAMYVEKLAKSAMDKQHAHFSTYKRVIDNIAATIANTMSWLALLLFFWASRAWFHDVEVHFVQVISAAILTATSLIGILALDFVADSVMRPQPERSALQKPVSAAADTSSLIPPTPTSAQDQFLQEALDLGNLEKGIRAVIGGISLSVGLAWEHAFHAATHTVIETNPAMRECGEASQLLIAVMSVLLMMPVWLKFIVTMARKSVHSHEMLMKESAKQK